ncbi:MAG: YgaP family membrane protein [Desulfomonilia bacterium]|jgi:uncharacterized membrane protein|uniref:Inner membrane protein YgaP-like transmembrane domain-containing protein n=1 Tax=anaerobic digester metagenome TaxID=1263854 RepID=A0A485LZK0_9ZZZZ|nr:DUF2892 domain-containing protein [Pseudomonadota bacterium]HON39342.1 DUF2892 domain-containing protein [Deltaproteobacteria bacterium]HRS57060.1 DUF2892 domain-containing protein [Desulfomonilia bacterium]HPD22378.1 DUF2892 domain-containing protein [Deltaproteobacteria bacterium]HPX17559.1 DUF2892 domain-containing protein [Deltaproteobacteria bacterium]
MEQNVGTLDRIIRLAVAAVLIFVLVKTRKVSLLNALLMIASGALISSASSGSCAIYTHLGISTSEKI